MREKRSERRGLPRSRNLFRVVTFTALSVAVLALPAASGASTSNQRAGSAGQSTLPAGASLIDGTQLVSANGKYRLNMQSDGNLVLYWEGHPVWASKTTHDAPDHAVMQNDGNLVIYKGSRVLWSTGSGGVLRSSRYFLNVQNDGNMVIYSPRHQPVWTSNTNVRVGLQYGDSGSAVVTLQKHLNSLGYWLGPPNGYFGDSTQQAVWALQKAAGVGRDGVVGSQSVAAIAEGVEPKIRPATGNLIEVDLKHQLVLIIKGGKLVHTLNTSTGGGYTYTDKGVTSVAITPTGVYHIFGVINGLDVDSLGALWRPRFFTYSGIAIHGDSYVPPFPVSHGCVRVSNEAINWIWADNIAPIGEEVWVF